MAKKAPEPKEEIDPLDLPGGAGQIAPGTYAPTDPDEVRRAYILEVLGGSAFDIDSSYFIEHLDNVDRWVKSGERAASKRPPGKVLQLIQKD